MEPTAVGSLTDCAICMEELNKPKFLPCHHTLCLNCVENLRSSHPGRGPVPCPFCRSSFSAPAATLPTNTYAEELVRLSRDAQEAGRQLEIVRDELEAVKTQLGETEDCRKEAINQKRSLDVALAATTSKLTELERNSSQSGQQLESRLRELESRESYLQDQLCKAWERLTDVECQREKAKIEAEASLAKAKQSCHSLRLLLQQSQLESSDRLQDAESRLSSARSEAETCMKAKNGVEASLARMKHSCRMLQQQLQLMQRETGERTKMLETELDQRKQDIIGLNEQLTTERLKMSQQIDYKKSHAEVVRLCLVLLALLTLTVTGAAVVLERCYSATIDARDAQLIDSNKLAQRVEEYSIQLQTAGRDARDFQRMLTECSDRLSTTQQDLNDTETELKDSYEALSGGDRGRNTTGGKGVEKTSDSASAGKYGISGVQLEEVHGIEHAQEMMKNGSSHLTQDRDDELGMDLIATKSFPHTNWLQQPVEKYRAVFPRTPVEKEKKLHGVKQQGCHCDESRSGTKAEGGEKTATGAKEADSALDSASDSATNSAKEQDRSCVRQLTEAQENLTIQEEMLRNCTGVLAAERQDKLRVMTTASGCTSELKWATQRLKTNTATLAECEERLKHVTTVLSNTMAQCAWRPKSKPKAPGAGLGNGDDGGGCESPKARADRAKLARCSEELTAVEDAVRWKTKQLEKCAEDLLQARGEVFSLTASLAEASSTHEILVENLEHAHREQLDHIMAELRLRHQEELEQTAAGCEVDSLLVPINKAIFVTLLIVMYLWLIPVGHNPLLLLVNYSRRFQTFVGMQGRQVLYRVNFVRPQHRQ